MFSFFRNFRPPAVPEIMLLIVCFFFTFVLFASLFHFAFCLPLHLLAPRTPLARCPVALIVRRDHLPVQLALLLSDRHGFQGNDEVSYCES